MDTLDPGWYWLVVFPNATATVNATASTQATVMMGVTTMNNQGARLSRTATFGALPSPFGTPAYTENAGVPYLGLKAQ